ncbi:hypothetical protein QO058_30430 (plasmid) [Bosea vestrisii]|uniref:hypothetical protein n=1 Tax=Bosea vestrisii TaxID=151416 RepID=UPI0024DFFF18|nr:hypothetical protein [Bosea vestrisii]WID99711.1 hypothetical protein QO058_30430 [Bosea vestrisii]
MVGGIFGGPIGSAIGGAVGGAIEGGGDSKDSGQAEAFEQALGSFAMQIANDAMADFDEVMAETEEDA